MKDLTVIVPVYNVERYLERSIDSLVNQTYKNLEILIINDGSTDNSRELLKKYECLENVRILDKKNEGVNIVRKLALEMVKTEYVTFADSDDYIDTDTYEITMKKLKEDKELDMLMFNHYIYFNNKMRVNQLNIEEEFVLIDNIMKSFLLGNINGYLWNKIYKTILFENLEYIESVGHDDMRIVFNIILCSCKKFLLWNKPKYHYLIRDKSISMNINAKYIDDYIKIILDINEKIKKHVKYNNLLVEVEYFKAIRLVHLLRTIVKINSNKRIYNINHLNIKINLKLLNKARKLYNINSRFFIINLLFIINKNIAYNIMKIIRKAKNTEQKSVYEV